MEMKDILQDIRTKPVVPIWPLLLGGHNG